MGIRVSRYHVRGPASECDGKTTSSHRGAFVVPPRPQSSRRQTTIHVETVSNIGITCSESPIGANEFLSGTRGHAPNYRCVFSTSISLKVSDMNAESASMSKEFLPTRHVRRRFSLRRCEASQHHARDPCWFAIQPFRPSNRSATTLRSDCASGIIRRRVRSTRAVAEKFSSCMRGRLLRTSSFLECADLAALWICFVTKKRGKAQSILPRYSSVVGRFLRNHYVVHVRFAQPAGSRAGNAVFSWNSRML